MKLLWDVLKQSPAQPKVTLVRAGTAGCCSTTRSGGGLAREPGSRRRPGEQERWPKTLLRNPQPPQRFLSTTDGAVRVTGMTLWARNGHAQPRPPAGIPPKRAAGSIAAPLTFSRIVCGRCETLFFLQLTWTKKGQKCLLNGLQMETATVWWARGFRKQIMRREFLLV